MFCMSSWYLSLKLRFNGGALLKNSTVLCHVSFFNWFYMKKLFYYIHTRNLQR